LDSSHDGQTKFVTHSSGEIVSSAIRPLKEENCDIVIRYNEAIPILRKVREKNEDTFDSIVSTKMPFGLTSTYKGKTNGAISVYAFRRMEKASQHEITRNADCVDKYKLIVPKAVGSGDAATDIIKPILAVPGTAATETYLMVGPFADKNECENVISSINTRFFHFMVTLQKNTHNCMKTMYSFVPMQDFNKPWTDEELYKKYELSDEEIKFIELTIWPAKIGGDE
jgi:site-specific DNA-methyltransferase (adenine-specific)